MPGKNIKPGNKKRRIWLLLFLLGIICFLSYFQFLYKSKQVDSNIFRLNRIIPAHAAEIWTVKFNPQGNLLASAGVDSTVKIWNKDNGALISALKHPIGVTYLAFSPDGQWLATSSYDEMVRIWKLPEGILIKTFAGHKGTVWCVNFSPDGNMLASSAEDATIKLWDTRSGQLIRTLTGHKLNIWDVKFSPDGSQLASASFDKTIKIWDTGNGQLLHNLTDHSEGVISIAFSPDGHMLVSTSDDKSIKLWDAHEWKLLRTLVVPEHVQASDFSPDNKRLLTGGRDKPVIGEFLQNFFGDSRYNKGVSMRLWDVKTGKLLQTFSHHGNDVNDVAFSPDGKWIADGSSDKTIELWRLSE